MALSRAAAPSPAPDPDSALLAEGDRLARQLAQRLTVGADDQTRVTLLGRSLAVNLVGALLPTAEQISRHSGRPLLAHLTTDDRVRALIVLVTPDGEVRGRLPVEDVLERLLTSGGRLHPTVQTSLQDALTGSEHHAARALSAALKSRPVLEALRRTLTDWLTRATPQAGGPDH